MVASKTIKVTEAEAKFMRRIRSLGKGQHLILVSLNGAGVESMSVLTGSKVERLASKVSKPSP